MKTIMVSFSFLIVILISICSQAGIRVTIGNDLIDGQHAFYFDKEKDSSLRQLERVQADTLKLQDIRVKYFLYLYNSKGEKTLIIDLAMADIDLVKFVANEGKIIDYPNAIYVPFSANHDLSLTSSKYDFNKEKIGYISLFGSQTVRIKATGKDVEALTPLLSATKSDINVFLSISSNSQADRIVISGQLKQH